MDEAYVAIFCPNCGVHLNEVDDAGTPLEGRPVSLGSKVRCGWCHTETFDWGHIPICRKTWAARQRLARRQTNQSLNRIVGLLEDMKDD